MSRNNIFIQAEQRLANAKTITCVDLDKTFTIGKELNMPKGKIDFDTAVANLVYWESRGWKVEVNLE